MMESYQLINGISTNVLTYGKDIGDDLSEVNRIILIIPGNPGVIEIYRDFMKILFDQLSEKFPQEVIPIWGVSYAGHGAHPPNASNNHKNPDIKDNPHLYSLDGQTEHKLDFIRHNIPSHIQIIGIGHSIGCKIWSEIMRLDANIEKQISYCYMLFPALERFKQTPNGRRINWLLSRQSLFLFVCTPVFYLPSSIKSMLLKLILTLRRATPCTISASMRIMNYTTVKCVCDLAQTEIKQVVDLDVETLQKSLSKLFFYFSTTDGWCPMQYVEDMKQKLPKMKHKVCDRGIKHAYTVNSSPEMATILANLITVSNT